MLTKDSLRCDFKRIRADIDKEQKLELDKRICENVINSPEFKNCDAVLLYSPIGDEIDTSLIFQKAKLCKIAIGYPKCNKNDKTMVFYRIDSQQQLKKGAYGICEPQECEMLNLNNFNNIVCIVPCLSCDDYGMRLGYGAGYYDRFFASQSVNITKIALCYDQCRTEKLQKDKYDVAVDFVATQNSLTEAKNEQ